MKPRYLRPISRFRPHLPKVYVGRISAVKTALLLSALGLCAGCQTPSRQRLDFVPVAATYNVALLRSMSGDNALGAMRRDFAALQRLGFNAVVLRHADPGRLPAAVEAAREVGLRPMPSIPDVELFVRTGKERENRTAPPTALDALVIESVVDQATARRAEQAAREYFGESSSGFALVLYRGGGVPLSDGGAVDLVAVEVTEGEVAPRGGGAVLLPCHPQYGQRPADAAPQWLADYHRGLSRGLTDGLIVEGFRVLPGRWRSLLEEDEPLAGDTATALRRVVKRAQHWCPRLQGMRPGPIEPLERVDEALQTTLFSHGKRRYVLVFNSSSTRFLRGTAELPVDAAGRSVHRAVLVPVDADVVAGEVVEARGGRLPLRFDLRPGDAQLWELF